MMQQLALTYWTFYYTVNSNVSQHCTRIRITLWHEMPCNCTGVFHPRYELACYQALGRALNGERMRYDPNCALSLGDAIEFGRAIEGMNNDYYEDPVWGHAATGTLEGVRANSDRNQHGGGQFRTTGHQRHTARG